MSSEDQFRPRLCHVRRWPDFSGYGFNLHAEKGRVGQFIGKVDEDSPAEAAGLKEGDRIVEVNGTNVGNENHQQVVQRIKAVPNETKLLVVDSETDAYFKQAKTVIRGDMPGVLMMEAEDKSSSSNHTDSPRRARLCRIKIWSDFPGYGFNLHAEKNKPGQFIGKVDEGSPAEAAGLREHDKIIEVNGDNISTENHQAVVGKIKSNPTAVELLVLDPQALTYFDSRGIIVSSQSQYTDTITCPDTKPEGLTPSEHPYTARSCLVRTWIDSGGFGFNMHTEKSLSGQFIGKIDTNSPAEYAGLKEGDRILEVNGESVSGVDHAGVVQRIRAIPGKTTLLVVDKEADDYFRSINLTVTSSHDFVERCECPESRPMANGTSVTNVEVVSPTQVNGGVAPSEDTTETKPLDDNENIQDEIKEEPKSDEIKAEEPKEIKEENKTEEIKPEEPSPVVEQTTVVAEQPTVNNHVEDKPTSPDPTPIATESVTTSPPPAAAPKKEAVEIGGIAFAASASDARKRMMKKKNVKDDPRSMKDKFEMFQRL